MDPIIEAHIQELWHAVRRVVAHILDSCDIHGFENIHLANPTVEQVSSILDNMIIPTLNSIISSDAIEDGHIEHVRLENIRQHTWQIRQIHKAILADDAQMFEEYRARLERDNYVP